MTSCIHHGFLLRLVILSSLVATGGCINLIGRGIDKAGEAWRDNVGSSSWAYGANLGRGVVRSVEERTHANGRLVAKFRDCPECWTVAFDEPLSDGGTVRCQILLPNKWNGKLWLVANDNPDGELPQRAVAFAQDGSAVVCGDGGMGQLRRRNGRLNPLAAAARDQNLRKAFFREALPLTLEGGKILTKRRYGRAPDKVCCYGRESGGAQALFLVAKDLSAISNLILINPALDFTSCAAYDLNVARQAARGASHSRLLRSSQFATLQRAAKNLKLESFSSDRTNELWSLAGKYDDSFSYNANLVPIICEGWRELFSPAPQARYSTPAVRFDMDFEPRLRERSWRMAWLFGEEETGAHVSDADFVAKLSEMSDYSPSADLSAFVAAGGKPILILESSNARMPAIVAEPLAEKLPVVRRVSVFTDRSAQGDR